MIYKMNLQFVFSYLGILPYIFILIDRFFLYRIKIEFILEFTLYYTLIIIVFIGSINWNLKKNISTIASVLGILPSIFAVFIISLNLINFNKIFLFIFLCIFLVIQLIGDYFFVFKEKKYKKIFYFLRFPLTIFIIFSYFLILVSIEPISKFA